MKAGYSGQYGKLLYAAEGRSSAPGPPRLQGLTATVLHFNIESRRSPLYSSDITATFGLADVVLTTSVNTSDDFQGQSMWEIVRDMTPRPPEVTALLALARAHPQEYAELTEGEAVLRALGG